MPQFNVAEAKTRLSQLVRKALAGEEIIIAKDNRPLLKLVPLSRRQQRKPGTAKGQVWMAKDFDVTPSDFKDYV
ncbi:MAG TPA: type II toxin-antitoxin system prevent-host-death family antitoxin [Candidatus Kryptonia bacterium]|nr:type II toxin-antitoxin system prevent-host-death family antitoxin [Candidatus Kryptonia bacterium]